MSNNATTKQTHIENYANKHLHQYINENGVWENYSNSQKINPQMEALLSDAEHAIKDLKKADYNPNESTTENDLHKIQGQFQAEEYYANEMGILGDDAVDFNAGIQYDSLHEHSETKHWGVNGTIFYTTSINHNIVNDHSTATASKTSADAFKESVEKCLTSLDNSVTLSDLIGSFNGLTKDDSIAADRNKTAMYLETKTEKTMVNNLVKMIKDQIEIDNHMTEKKHGGHTKTLSDYQEILLENDQSTLLSSMRTALDTDQVTVHGKEEHLRGEINAYSFGKVLLAKVFGIATDTTQKSQLKKDKALFQTIIQAANDLDTVGADISMRAFQSVMNSVNGLMKDMKQILADVHLSPKEKEVKLAKLLQIMLGLLQIFIQVVENCRSQNKQKMEKAETVAQKLNFQTIKTNTEIFTSLEKTEHTSSIVQNVMKDVEIALSTLFIATGNIGMAVMMTTMLVLQEKGDLSKWTSELASKEGGSKTGASFTMAGIALGATMLGGVGIDLIAERIVSEISTTIVAAVSTDVAESLGQKMVEDTNEKIATSYESLLKETTETAVKAAARESYKKISLAALGKNIWNYLVDSEFRQDAAAGLKAEMKVFVKDVGEKAYKQGLKRVTSEAQQATVKALTDTEIKAFAQETASRLLIEPETVLGENAGFLKKLTTGVYGRNLDRALESVPRLRNALYSGFAAGTYTLAATNLATNAYTTHCTDDSKKKKNGIEILLEIMQEIVQMLAMVKGGGAIDTMKSGDPSAALSAMFKGAAFMQLAEQGTQTFCAVEKGVTLDQQATATGRIQTAQAYDNELRALAGQDKSSTDPSASGLNIEYKRLEQEQAWLAEHVADNTNAADKVLLAQSV